MHKGGPAGGAARCSKACLVCPAGPSPESPALHAAPSPLQVCHRLPILAGHQLLIPFLQRSQHFGRLGSLLRRIMAGRHMWNGGAADVQQRAIDWRRRAKTTGPQTRAACLPKWLQPQPMTLPANHAPQRQHPSPVPVAQSAAPWLTAPRAAGAPEPAAPAHSSRHPCQLPRVEPPTPLVLVRNLLQLGLAPMPRLPCPPLQQHAAGWLQWGSGLVC